MRKNRGSIKTNSLVFRLFTLTLIVFAIGFASYVSIGAQTSAPADTNSQPEDIKVGRISLILGTLSMMRGDDPDWFEVRVNMPVQTGDRLYTDTADKAELELGSNFFVRLGSQTGMDILDLSTDRAQLRMFSGSLVVNLRRKPKQSIEIDTPSGAVTLAEAGEYRIDVLSNTQSQISVWQGDASVFADKDIVVHTGQLLLIQSGEYPFTAVKELPEPDSWDQWNQQRDYQLAQASSSLDYVADNRSVEGVEDLSDYGNWTNTEDYGEVWTPTDVGTDWAPYQDGGWVWRDPCGWTWVSSEPWGWAPYHYGTWTILAGRWCWVPGSDRHYSPAQVGWVDHGPKGAIGWVPLSPKDKTDTSRPRGRALDGNHVPYANQKVRNGTSIATREGFVGGKSYHHGGAGSDPGLGTGRVVSQPQIVPTRDSLVTKTSDKPSPTQPIPAFINRTVVTRNNDIPVVRPFTDKLAEIKANGGAPVSAVKLTPSGAKATRQLTPTNANTNQSVGGGEVPQPNGGARGVVPMQTSPLPQRTETTSRPQQQTNINQPQNGGLNPRNSGVQRQGNTQPTNQSSGPDQTGNVNRQQKGADQPQSNLPPARGAVQQQPPPQKPQTPAEPSQGNVYRPNAEARPAGRETQKTEDTPKQPAQQEPNRPQPLPQKPQVPDQQERDQQRQQQQEQDRQVQQQKNQENQRQAREHEQQQEQERQAQQQKEQENQRQRQQQADQERQRQAEPERGRQQQADQERQRQQQADQDHQRQQQAEQERSRQQQAEQDHQRQQQAEQERNRQQQAEQERQRQQQADQDRQRQQQAEQERQNQQAEQERQRQQQAEQERQRQQQADQERQRQQQAEQEQQRQQQAEQQRQQQAEQQRQQQAEQERQRQQQAEQQRQQQAEQERQRQQQPKKDPPTSNR